jgi:hypothetical protein
LGATTVLLMMLPRLRLSEAFGIGAGAAFVEGVVMEVVEVQKGTPHGQHVAEQVEASLANRFVPAFLSIADRLVASVAHVCSRALIFLSVRTGNPVPALTAFITFAAIDGYAGYALGQKWSFGKLPVALKVYGPMAGLATVQGFVLLAVL